MTSQQKMTQILSDSCKSLNFKLMTPTANHSSPGHVIIDVKCCRNRLVRESMNAGSLMRYTCLYIYARACLAVVYGNFSFSVGLEPELLRTPICVERRCRIRYVE